MNKQFIWHRNTFTQNYNVTKEDKFRSHISLLKIPGIILVDENMAFVFNLWDTYKVSLQT